MYLVEYNVFDETLAGEGKVMDVVGGSYSCQAFCWSGIEFTSFISLMRAFDLSFLLLEIRIFRLAQSAG